MTILDDRPVEAAAPLVAADAAPVEVDATASASTSARPVLVGAAAFLASAAAAWMMTGVFVGVTARLVGVGAALLGAGMFVLGARTSRPALVHVAALPVAAVVGAVLVTPDATGGTANLPRLVVEALKTGGLASPPIPFDPGWRFLLTLLVSSLSMVSATWAYALAKPKLAVLLPAPVAAVAVLVQPPGRELVSVGVSLVLLVGALAVAFGADLTEQGATGRTFEVRRFMRAGSTLLLLVAVLAGVSQLGFLFPEVDDSQVIPPKRPEPPPAAPDRVLFTVRADVAVPWRLGVLDVYDDNAWLTPPFDPRRFEALPPSGRVPGGEPPADGLPSIQATFEIADIEGRNVPDVAAAYQVKDAPGSLEVDPRTGSFRLGARARQGTRYTVTAAAPPTSKALLRAPAPAPERSQFLEAPSPPEAVQRLLDAVPADLPRYERLQFVRTRYYESVVAAGPGNPIDVPPGRVAELLEGKEASPYEITAGEALLARWAGVPARIGYGYFGGEAKEGFIEVRPRHGAMWLEVHFEGIGWTPIVGRPPRARSSLNPDDKQDDPTIRPTEELAALVHVPIRLSRITLLYRLVQYWAARLAPAALLVAVGLFLYPGGVKALRAVRRRRWAARAGFRARVAVAYAELRDAALDLNLGHPTMTPLEFLRVTDDDVEHRQLAWLVTRSLWGDLGRDLRVDDVERAEQWARSVRRRLVAAQTPVPRIIGVASRASLIEPYDGDVPNLWWRVSLRATAARLLRPRFRSLLRAVRRRLPVPASTAVVLALAVSVLGGCVRDVDMKASDPAVAREAMPPVPPTIGDYRFDIEPRAAEAFAKLADVSLVSVGEVYAIRDREGVVAGTLQVAAFKPSLRRREADVRDGLLRSVVGGRLRPERLGNERVYTARLPEQRVLLAFTPDRRAYQLLVASRSLPAPEQFFVDLLAAQRGQVAVSLAASGVEPPPDPRRGEP